MRLADEMLKVAGRGSIPGPGAIIFDEVCVRELSDVRIGVIGLGYVGLPLAVEFARHFPTIGFDIDDKRVTALREGRDHTREIADADLLQPLLRYSHDAADLATCNVFIVTVPTPIDHVQNPDLRPLTSASELVAGQLKHGDLVIYESTVYPGTTEEVCVPILERISGLRVNLGFHCGYSPERVNPGDQQRRLPDIVKITSGSDAQSAAFVDALYRTIIKAGTHPAPSIRVAEAAKVIENTQRDVNIALINELALMFNRLGIDTMDVLEAAGTKWNFLSFRPGLVGGHCIGVDPYYLLHRSHVAGYHPQLIDAARRINNQVSGHVANRVLTLLEANNASLREARVLVLGLTFKEDCPDLRNSKVVDIVRGLQTGGIRQSIDVFDPWADVDEAREEFDIELVSAPEQGVYDAIVLAVAHGDFRAMTATEIQALGKPGAVIYDAKSIWPRDLVSERL